MHHMPSERRAFMNSRKIRWLLWSGCLGAVIFFAGFFAVLVLTHQEKEIESRAAVAA